MFKKFLFNFSVSVMVTEIVAAMMLIAATMSFEMADTMAISFCLVAVVIAVPCALVITVIE